MVGQAPRKGVPGDHALPPRELVPDTLFPAAAAASPGLTLQKNSVRYRERPSGNSLLQVTPGISLELPGRAARSRGRTCTGESHGIHGIRSGTISSPSARLTRHSSRAAALLPFRARPAADVDPSGETAKKSNTSPT
jgi:hypothetical protein